jgi:hypothetical protein
MKKGSTERGAGSWNHHLFHVAVVLGLIALVCVAWISRTSRPQHHQALEREATYEALPATATYAQHLEERIEERFSCANNPSHDCRRRRANNDSNSSLKPTGIPALSPDVGQHRRQRMEAYLSERAKCDDRSTQESTGWVSLDLDAANITYKSAWEDGERKLGKQTRYAGFSLCEVEDESASSGWIFTRMGPFLGRGGYDWHSGGIHNVPRNPKAKFITAKMFAPVLPDGRILGYPPVHTHHVHYSLDSVQHFLDSHGDSICSEEQGGTACYLREQPEGYGLPLLESDQYTLDFMLNDVREAGSPALTFYLETSVRWSSDMTLTQASRANLRMHNTKHSYKTVLLPLEDESVVWNTGKWLVDGRVIYSPLDQTPWVHSHRSFLRGEWAFAASPEDLGLTSDLLQQTPQESVPEGSSETSKDRDMCWIKFPRGKDAKRSLFDKIKNSKAGMESLRCWMVPSEEERTLEFVKGTDTSLAYPEAWQQGWDETWYDRVGQVHCNEWSFRKGDNYTIVAINGLHDELAGLDKPNLQHYDFKLEYESTGDMIGPNLEVYAPFADEFSTAKGAVESMYKIPVSYMKCLTEGGVHKEDCTAEARNLFAQAYYDGLESGEVLGEEYKRSLESSGEEVLRTEYNMSNPEIHVHDHKEIPF